MMSGWLRQEHAEFIHSYRRESRVCGHGCRREGRCAVEYVFVQVLF